jgi:hypothetical protein
MPKGDNFRRPVESEPAQVFDPDGHYAEVHTPEGVRYLQTKYLFDRAHNYMGVAPPHMWLAPLTEEQQRNLRIQRQKNKGFFQAGRPKVKEAGVPQKIIDAEKENARAAAAESAAA